MRYIDPSILKPAMIVGVTETLNPFDITEKITINGLSHALDPKISTHIAMIYDKGYGVLEFIEMAPPHIETNPLKEYDNGWLGAHVVFIGDPFCNRADPAQRMMANSWLMWSMSIRIKYNLMELLKFWGVPEEKDDKKIICSDLPRNMYRALHFEYPKSWDDKCSPFDWQAWNGLTKINLLQ